MRPPSATSQAVSLRRWTPADDAFVARLAEEAFGEYDAQPARYLLRATHRETAHTWVAVEAGAPVGMVVLERTAGEWCVLAVAVTTRARARGVGGRLMEVVESQARARGASQIALFTADANLAALDLFLRRGFRIIARRRGFYARGQDACRLVKDLRAAAQ